MVRRQLVRHGPRLTDGPYLKGKVGGADADAAKQKKLRGKIFSPNGKGKCKTFFVSSPQGQKSRPERFSARKK